MPDGAFKTLLVGSHAVAGLIEDPRVAIRAAKIGVEMERAAAGLPKWIMELASMSDSELMAEYRRLFQPDNGH